MRIRICLGLLVLMVGGCVPRAGLPAADPRTAAADAPVVAAPLETVWQALPDVYDSLGLEISFVEPADHRLASTRARNLWLPVVGPWQASYARCVLPELTRTGGLAVGGRGGLAVLPVSLPPGRVMFSVETSLQEMEQGTRVVTRLRASAVQSGSRGMMAEPYCVSTGRLEKTIAEALEQRLAPSVEQSAARGPGTAYDY